MSPKKKLFAALLFASATGAMIPAQAEDGGFQADKNFSANDQAKDLLAEGVREYRAGRYKASSAAFRQRTRNASSDSPGALTRPRSRFSCSANFWLP